MSGKSQKALRRALRVIEQERREVARPDGQLVFSMQKTHVQLAIPTAQELAQYDSIEPGLARRIVGMAEDQGDHRRLIEDKVVSGNIAVQARGQHYAFVLALCVFLLGAGLIVTGKITEGVILISADLASLSLVFLGARAAQLYERIQKARKVPPPPADRG